MATGTREVVSAAEIPADRRFRIDEERLRKAVDAGILAPDHGAGDRISLDQYHQLGEAGILNESDRVELIGGWLVARERINPPHRISTRKVRVAVERILPPGWYADEQKPLSLPTSQTEPQPDLQVTRGDTTDYMDRHPGPLDVAFVVEVSDSSLSGDRTFKRRLYALDSVPIYWIVNLRDLRIEVYTDPSGPSEIPDYRQRRDYLAGEEIPVILDGQEVARIAASELLP